MNQFTSTFWTDAKVEVLKRLYFEGLSASEIAAQIGASSRNVVIGKLNRMDISRHPVAQRIRITQGIEGRRGAIGNVTRTTKSAASSFGSINPTRAAVPPTIIEINDMARTDGFCICDDEFKGCKWPIGGDGAEMRFCCLPSVGQTYCQIHARRALNASQPIPKEDAKLFKFLVRRAA